MSPPWLGCLSIALLVASAVAQAHWTLNGGNNGDGNDVGVGGLGIGFCMDNVPPALAAIQDADGFGFAAKSNLTKIQCAAGGHQWCPLLRQLKDYKGIQYYWFSTCCVGRQGSRLIADQVTGWPSCFKDPSSGIPWNAKNCKRWMWNTKIDEDLGFYPHEIYDRSNRYYYDYQVPPVMSKMDPTYYTGQPLVTKAACVCAANSTHCMKKSADGRKCLWCKDMGFTRCKEGWIRNWWYDYRLSFDYQCYGGIGYISSQLHPGSLENSRMWVPDIELINNEVPIWGDHQAPRLGIMYSCWNGNPTRGGCGYVWSSKPIVVKGLCTFGGLVMFPMDILTCEFEVGGFTLTGFEMDMKPHNAGVSWAGQASLEKHNMAGITGGSAYQDYTIKTGRCRRDIATYACCNEPFPVLIFEFEFTRSNYFYQMKLFIPSITITFVSFAAFWLSPDVGERLGYAASVILAVLMNDVTATQMMPVCDATLLMDYVSLVCFFFAVIATLETILVLNLYHRTDRNWYWAGVPVGGMRILNQFKWKARKMQARRAGIPDPPPPPYIVLPENREGLLRLQLYKETFFALDRNHSGDLEIIECHMFAKDVLGTGTRDSQVDKTLDCFDTNGNGVLSFDEFVNFCEHSLKQKDDIELLTKLLRGYVRAVDREQNAIREMWRTRAGTVDTIARVAIPIGYFLALGIILTKEKKDLEAIMRKTQLADQWLLKAWGLFPLGMVIGLYIIYLIYRCPRKKAQAEADAGSLAGEDGVPDRTITDISLEAKRDEAEPKD